jgi:hypothetical protein
MMHTGSLKLCIIESFSLSEFRTGCDNNFLLTLEEGGEEREREGERVPDRSNISFDEDTSDDDGEEQSDDVSETQSVGSVNRHHGGVLIEVPDCSLLDHKFTMLVGCDVVRIASSHLVFSMNSYVFY